MSKLFPEHSFIHPVRTIIRYSLTIYKNTFSHSTDRHIPYTILYTETANSIKLNEHSWQKLLSFVHFVFQTSTGNVHPAIYPPNNARPMPQDGSLDESGGVRARGGLLNPIPLQTKDYRDNPQVCSNPAAQLRQRV